MRVNSMCNMTGLCGFPDIPSKVILEVCLRVFLDEISTSINPLSAESAFPKVGLIQSAEVKSQLPPAGKNPAWWPTGNISSSSSTASTSLDLSWDFSSACFRSSSLHDLRSQLLVTNLYTDTCVHVHFSGEPQHTI